MPMPFLLATIRGDLRAAMEAEIRDVARAMPRQRPALVKRHGPAEPDPGEGIGTQP